MTRTDAYTDDAPGVVAAMDALATEFPSIPYLRSVRAEAIGKNLPRVELRRRKHDETVRDAGQAGIQ